MFRYTAFAAAILALAAACSNATAPGTVSSSAPIDPATLDTARGRILALNVDSVGSEANALAPILMLTDAGDTLQLVGPVAEFLASGEVGVELWVGGSRDGDAMQVVQYALRDDSVQFCDSPITQIKPDVCQDQTQMRKPNARAALAKRR